MNKRYAAKKINLDGAEDIESKMLFDDASACLERLGFKKVWDHFFKGGDEVSKKTPSFHRVWWNKKMNLIARGNSYRGCCVDSSGKPTYYSSSDRYDEKIDVVNAITIYWMGDCGWHEQSKKQTQMPSGSGGYEMTMDGRMVSVRHTDVVNGSPSLVSLLSQINKAGGFFVGDSLLVSDFSMGASVFIGEETFSQFTKRHGSDYSIDEKELIREAFNSFIEKMPEEIRSSFYFGASNRTEKDTLPPRARDSVWDFSRFIRHSLRDGNKKNITLADRDKLISFIEVLVGKKQPHESLLHAMTEGGVGFMEMAAACETPAIAKTCFDFLKNQKDDVLFDVIMRRGHSDIPGLLVIVDAIINEPLNKFLAVSFFTEMSRRFGERLDFSEGTGVLDIMAQYKGYPDLSGENVLVRMLCDSIDFGAVIIGQNSIEKLSQMSEKPESYRGLEQILSKTQAQHLTAKTRNALFREYSSKTI